MIPTKRARRLVTALVLPAVLLTAAACSSDGSETESGTTPDPVATVSGEPGEQPEVTVPEGTVLDQAVTEVIEEGDGRRVGKGDYLRMDVYARTVKGDELVNTWAPAPDRAAEDGSASPEPEEESGEDTPRNRLVTQAGQESALPKPVTGPLVGSRVGSRVLIEGSAEALLGSPAAGRTSAEEGMVWVFDILDAVSPEAEVEGEQVPTAEGMPEVEAGGKKPATITVPEGQDPPEELAEQVLIEGDGSEVRSEQTVIVQYTGVLWESGEKFDSTWDRTGAFATQIGVGQVVEGWDEGLIGKHVGDRVLLVVPPGVGYGEEQRGSIPGGSTLVFVIDILGTS